MKPQPIAAPTPELPDRDFDVLLKEAMVDLRAVAIETWTDHNASDPGITLLDAALWAVADLHYRTANRTWLTWPVEAGAHRPHDERHWSEAPLPSTFDALASMTDVLADHPELISMVAEAQSQRDAVALVQAASPGLEADHALAIVRLLRERRLLRVALDAGPVISEALAAAEREQHPDRQAVAAERLAADYPDLWPEESRAAVGRHVAVEQLRALRLRADELRTRIGASANLDAAAAEVSGITGLDEQDARQAAGVHPRPPGADPEDFETPDGATKHWPAHPLQARPVEPVTSDDYARLARMAPGVRRVWVIPGVLPGVGWDGQQTTVAERPGASSILVEPDVEPEDDDNLLRSGSPDQREFLVSVLRHGLSAPGDIDDDKAVRDADATKRAEVDDPHVAFRTDLARQSPRRLICDEIGAAMLERCEVAVRGVLHAPVTADRMRLLQDAQARVERFFAEGPRPAIVPEATDASTTTDEPSAGYDGPWAPPPPEAGGWQPGDPVRIGELTQVLADDPRLLGVEDVAARVRGGDWQREKVELGRQCVPVLHQNCLKVELTLEVGE